MKFRILILLFFCCGISYSQTDLKLKKRNFGVYTGAIPTYKFDSGEDLITVDETKLTLELQKDFVELQIGNEKMRGSYYILFEGSAYFVLEAKMEGQDVPERIVVYKKDRKLVREGIYPQPNAVLIKE